MIVRITRHLQIYAGRDFYRNRPFHVIVGCFKRSAAPMGEFSFRLMIEVGFDPLPSWSLMTIPAWTEVPSVEAEYWRTMR
ncbi:hypothetical protein HGP14_02730 [Rhizobium sp. P32RR-XVIII]|uniref:hypothetical protein n=1 Tax=Rhizobium sp. P32RR-XVIII TaxID=2726738 RepID=UPI001457612C|nr:hypothetical protein [Rhizobium sp. P32RR-XVIII]NLS02284.1 hypothetical protein [Rhizobium sp. P32RR-XVIII]